MITDAELAWHCAMAYTPVVTVEAGSDLAVSVTPVDGSVVVAFRGTANIAGWLRDLDVMPKSHDQLGYCHNGFLNGASLLWSRLDLPEGVPIILTGHSLGGALAVIVGALRLVANERVDRLVTFGAPRAGYSKLASIWNDKDVRQYRRGNDPVPTVPWELLAFPYKHVRDQIMVGKDSNPDWRSHDIHGYMDDVPR